MKNSLFYYPSFNLDSILDRVFDNHYLNFASRLSLDVNEKGDYVLSLPLAGYKQEEVFINVENSELFIKAENKKLGVIQKSLVLGDLADLNKIEAKFENGLLEVIIPKKEEAKPKRIQIQVK